MYAQRGHGKRSGYYSDYTFGVWAPDGSLVPVGKAYFGFTDEELAEIDRFVRTNTTERFGPVRAVRAEPDHGLVLEVAFEGLAPLHPPPLRRRHALPPHLAACAGTSPRPRPTGSRRWRRCSTGSTASGRMARFSSRAPPKPMVYGEFVRYGTRMEPV